MIVSAHTKFGLVQIKGSGVKRPERPERAFEIPAWIGLTSAQQAQDKCKMLLENFAQGFLLCIVLILIRHDPNIRKPAKSIVCKHFNGFWRFCPTIRFSR